MQTAIETDVIDQPEYVLGLGRHGVQFVSNENVKWANGKQVLEHIQLAGLPAPDSAPEAYL